MDRKTRILTVVRHPTGGVRTYLRYTYTHLDPCRFHFTVVSLKAEEIEQIKADLKGLSPDIIEVERFGFPFALSVLRALWKQNLDVIHSQGFSGGILVSLINLLFGIPHIITLHGTFDRTAFTGRFGGLKRRAIAVLLSRADVLNVVSEDARANLLEHFQEFEKCVSKIVTIENGIDTAWFKEDSQPQRQLTEITGIDDATIVIGYLGRYMPEKGFPVLISAIERIVHSEAVTHKFKVLALGWGAYIREYQAQIRQKGLDEYFVFIEFQSDVRWVLRQIDMLVIPSLCEAFGLVAVEALVCGTPIIASNCIGLRQTLSQTPARMVEPGSSEGLADAILDSIRDPRKQEALAYVPIAITKFDVSVTAHKLQSQFESLARSNES